SSHGSFTRSDAALFTRSGAPRRELGELHLHLVLERRVVVLEDHEHLGTAEVVRYLAAFGQHLPQHSAADDDAILDIVRARLERRHAVAPHAIEGPVDLERLQLERIRRDLVEDLLRVEGTVEVPDAGMIASDDQVATAEVLP